MARLTKAQQTALERQRVWDEAYDLAARIRLEEEERRRLEGEAAAQERAANPWGRVQSGSSTVAVSEESSDPWASAGRAALGAIVPAARISSDQLRSMGTGVADIGANVLDALSPDPNPVAYANAREQGRTPFAVEETVQDAADIGLGLLSNAGRVAEWTGQEGMLDRALQLTPFGPVLPSASVITATAEAEEATRMNRSASEMAVREALGQPSFEQIRQGSVFNTAADSLRDWTQGVRTGKGTEAQQARGQNLATAMEGGFGSTVGFLASGEGIQSIGEDLLPGSAPYMVGGAGASAGLRAVGLGARGAALGGATATSFATTLANAQDAEQAVLGLSPEALAESPKAASMLAQGQDIEHVRSVLAREARMKAIAASVAVSPASVIPALNPLERIAAGAASNPLSTGIQRVTVATLAGIGGEAIQEGGEALQSNIGEAAAGIRSTADLGEGVAGSALIGAALGGPIAGTAESVASTREFGARADRLRRMADGLDVRRDNREQARFEEETMGRLAEEEAVRAAEEAQRSFITSGPIPTTDGVGNAGRATESFENYAAREGADVLASEEAQRQFLAQNTLESSNAALQNSLREGPRGVRAGPRLDDAAMAGENARWVSGVANEQLEQEAFEEEAMSRLAEQDAAAEARVAAVTEATELDKRLGGRELSAAKQRHQAARRTHLEQTRRQNAALPDAERIALIADAAQEWDRTNPSPTTQAAPATRRQAKRARAATAVSPELLAEAGMSPDEIVQAAAATDTTPTAAQARVEALRNRRAGRADASEAVSTGRTAADVVRSLAQRVAKGNSRAALAQEQLLLNGKLSISDPDVIAQVAQGNARGYYDGERMYINADVIPEGNESAAVLNEILAHEADHAARISGNADAKSKVSTLLGDGATSRLIEQLETSSHPVAQGARDMVQAAGIDAASDPARYQDELTAYAISQAMANQQGGVWAPVRGLVSAARRKFKEFTGSEDINLDDLAAYAQQTIDALATSEQSIAAETDGREMIVGPNAVNWDSMDNRYRGRVDGMERAEISDANAEIDDSSETLTQMARGEKVALEDFLSHSSLFDNYPQLARRTVSVEKLPGNAFAAFDGRNIQLSEGLVGRAMVDPVEAEFLRRVVLHEVQHSVQEIEGFVGGAASSWFIPKEIAEDYALRAGAFERTVNGFDLDRAVTTLSPEDRAAWNDHLNGWKTFNSDFDFTTPQSQKLIKRQFLNDGWGARSNNGIITSVQDKYNERKALLLPARDAYQAAMDVASRKYFRVYGEAEARNTEYRSRMDDSSIRLIPPEDTFELAPNGVALEETTSVRGSNTRPGRVSNEDAAAGARNAAGRADNSADAPRVISPESVVRDVNGKPLTVYHGTSNPFDTFDAGRGGAVTGAASARQGFFFTDRRKTAEYYAKADGTTAATRRVEESIAKAKGQQPRNFGPRVIEANLNITNPLVHDFKGKAYREQTYNDLITRAKSAGNDGVILRNTFDAGETSRVGALFSGRISPETIYVAFSPEQIVPAQREGRASTVAPTPTTTAPYQPEKGSRLVQAIRDNVPDPILNTLTVGGAAGKGMFNMSQDAENARNAVYQSALSYNARLDRAFEKAAKAKGVTKKALNDTILKRLEAIAAIPDVMRKDTLVARIAQEYPELRGLVEAIQDINAETDAIIDARLADPREISEEELARLEYMDRNKYSYMTNLYAAFQSKAGQDYKNRLLDHYERGRALATAGKEVPDNIKREYDVYSKAMRWIAANDVAVSDPEQLAALPIEDVEGLYNMWHPERDTAQNLRTRMNNEGTFDTNAYRDFMADGIAEWVQSADTATIEHLSNAVLQNLLNNETVTGPARRYGKGGGIDNSILEHRKEVPPVLQELYGKVRDIPALINATLTRQGELAERMRFFNRMREETNEAGMPYVVSQRESADPRFAGYNVRLSGESYGAVDGMFTTEAIARSIDDYTQESVTLADTLALVSNNPSIARKFAGQKWFENWTKLAGAQKAMKIITRPDYMMMNLAGSVLTPILTGGVSFTDYKRGISVMTEHMAHTINPSKDEQISMDLRLALEMGLFDNAVTQEIRRAPRAMVQKLIKEMTQESDLIEVGDKLTGAAKTAWNTLVEAYSMSDAWAKIPVGLRRIDYLRSYYDANGDSVENERLVQEAAAFVRDSTIGMQAVPAGVKLGERLGLTFYAPYFYSAFRALGRAPVNMWNDAKMALDAKTPEARNIAASAAATKAAGMGITATMLTAAMKGLADDLMDDEEREQRDRDRALMFPNDAIGDTVYLGTDEAGRRMYINLSRIDQWGPATDIYRALRENPDGESAAKIVAESMYDLIIMNRAIGVVVSRLAGKEKSTQVERVFEAEAQSLKDIAASVTERIGSPEFGYKAMDLLIDVGDLVTPAGIMNFLDPNNTRPQEVDGMGRGALAGMFAALGHKFVAVDEKQSLGMAAREVQKHRQDARGRVRDAISGNGPEAGLEAHLRESRTEQKLVHDLGRKWEAVIGGKTSPRQAAAILKEAGLDARTISNINKQAYTSEVDEWARQYSRILTQNSAKEAPFSRSVLSPEEEKAREKAWREQAKEVRRRLKARGYTEERK